jgi:hypothetical protein
MKNPDWIIDKFIRYISAIAIGKILYKSYKKKKKAEIFQRYIKRYRKGLRKTKPEETAYEPKDKTTLILSRQI